jgi:DNA invertase Pin-like site-specific DNA recombinase
MTRAAIYCRISRDDQGEGLGVSRQEEDCRRLCKQRGWGVSIVLHDNDLSAYRGVRPGYDELLQGIKDGHIEAVVAWAPERLHRSPRQLEDFIELVEENGVVVETVKAGAWDVSTSHGRLIARMLGAVSRAESERTGERVKRAHLQARASGFWRGAIPYGMDRHPKEKGVLVPKPAEARVVREIGERVLTGEAVTSIANDLNRRKLAPKRGSHWTHTSVSRLITSPALGGFIEIDGALRPAKFDGLFPADEWRTIKSSLVRRPRGEKQRPRDRLSLLGGLLRCDHHDAALQAIANGPYKAYGAQVPGLCHVTISRPPMDEFVSRLVVERLSAPDAADLFQPLDSPRLNSEVELIASRREDIAQLLAEGLLSRAEATPQLDKLKSQLEALEVPRRSPMPWGDLRNPAAAWERLSTVQRHDVIRTLFSKISVAHQGSRNGPTVRLERVHVRWAQDA